MSTDEPPAELDDVLAAEYSRWRERGTFPSWLDPSERRGLRPDSDEDFAGQQRRAAAWGVPLTRSVYEAAAALDRDIVAEVIQERRQTRRDRIRSALTVTEAHRKQRLAEERHEAAVADAEQAVTDSRTRYQEAYNRQGQSGLEVDAARRAIRDAIEKLDRVRVRGS